MTDSFNGKTQPIPTWLDSSPSTNQFTFNANQYSVEEAARNLQSYCLTHEVRVSLTESAYKTLVEERDELKIYVKALEAVTDCLTETIDSLDEALNRKRATIKELRTELAQANTSLDTEKKTVAALLECDKRHCAELAEAKQEYAYLQEGTKIDWKHVIGVETEYKDLADMYEKDTNALKAEVKEANDLAWTHFVGRCEDTKKVWEIVYANKAQRDEALAELNTLKTEYAAMQQDFMAEQIARVKAEELVAHNDRQHEAYLNMLKGVW